MNNHGWLMLKITGIIYYTAPTQLSQCFARQGVKIPTRRDTKSKRMRKTSSGMKEVEKQQQQRQQSNE